METRVSIPALQDAITNFENKKAALENAYLKISNEVRNLDATWHGEASEKFKSQFDAMYKNLQQTEERMEGAITKLNKAVEIYEEVDEQVKTGAENLEEGKASYY